MSDVLNRLRIFLHKNCAQYFAGSDIMREAADEIERQQQRIRELEAALTTISLCSKNSMSSKHECGVIARKALEQKR